MPGTWTTLDLSTAILLPTDNPYGAYDGTGIVRARGYPNFRLPGFMEVDRGAYYDIEVTYDGTYGSPGFWMYSQLPGESPDDAHNDSWWDEFASQQPGGRSYVVKIGPGIDQWDDAMSRNETGILFESDGSGASQARLIGLRWREADPPPPPPSETLHPGEGSDFYQNAQYLASGQISYPTSTVGKTEDPTYETTQSQYWTSYQSMWWKIYLPSTWATDGSGDSLRVDLTSSTVPDTHNVQVQVFTGMTAPSNRISARSGSNVLDFDTYIRTDGLEQTAWVKVGFNDDLGVTATIVLAMGRLILTPVSTPPITPDVLKVRLSQWANGIGSDGGKGNLAWPTEPLPDVGETMLPYDGTGIDNGWKIIIDPWAGGQTTMRGAEWDIFNFGHDDWPVNLTKVENMVRHNQIGDGVREGTDIPQTPDGVTRYNDWGYNGPTYNGNMGGFTRQEWGHISTGGGGSNPYATTFSDAAWIRFKQMFTPDSPDLPDGRYHQPWKPALSGLTNPYSAYEPWSYTIDTPGVLSDPVLTVALKLNTLKEGSERVVLGIARGVDPSQPPQFPDVINAMTVLGVFTAPTVAQTSPPYPTMQVQLKVRIPADMAYDPISDLLIATGSPSVYPNWGSLPSEPGFSPGGYPPTWESRYGALTRAYPDFTVDSWVYDASIAYSVEYDYQPPVIHWFGEERSTEGGEPIGLGRLKVKVDAGTWKFMAPLSGENAGIGVGKWWDGTGWKRFKEW
jgi:hypothetical protein